MVDVSVKLKKELMEKIKNLKFHPRQSLNEVIEHGLSLALAKNGGTLYAKSGDDEGPIVHE